jgi:hypothetical protein
LEVVAERPTLQEWLGAGRGESVLVPHLIDPAGCIYEGHAVSGPITFGSAPPGTYNFQGYSVSNTDATLATATLTGVSTGFLQLTTCNHRQPQRPQPRNLVFKPVRFRSQSANDQPGRCFHGQYGDFTFDSAVPPGGSTTFYLPIVDNGVIASFQSSETPVQATPSVPALGATALILLAAGLLAAGALFIRRPADDVIKTC